MFMSSSHLISYLDAATLYLKRDQMELTAMLRVFKRLHPRVCVMYNNPRNTLRSSHEKLLDILSWIAVLFKDGGRSNVAAALKIFDNLPPALIISTDQGSVPTVTDEAIMDKFKTMTFLALKAPNDTALHITGFNRLLVQHAWPQIQADIKNLRDTHFKFAGVEVIVDIKTRYAAIWDAWMAFRKKVERSPINETPKDQILAHLERLLNDSEPDTTERRAEYFAKIVHGCKVIDSSRLFKESLNAHGSGGDPIWQVMRSKEDASFLSQIQYRIKAILSYGVGPETYLSVGIQEFRSLYQNAQGEDNFKRGLTFIWTGKAISPTIPKALKWNNSPSDWLSKFAHENDVPVEQLARLNSTLSDCWKKGDTFHGHLHCEIAMIDFIKKQGVRIKYNIIGTAKPLCWACRKFFDSRGAYGSYYKHRMDEAEFPEDWMLLSSVGLNEDEFEKGCIDHVIDRTKDLFKDGLIEALDDLDTADRD